MTMGWFVSASFISLMLGLVMVNLLQPGANFPGTVPDKGQATGLAVSAFSLEKFLTHLVPTSIADAMAQNEILQIVIFAVFFAVAMGAMVLALLAGELRRQSGSLLPAVLVHAPFNLVDALWPGA